MCSGVMVYECKGITVYKYVKVYECIKVHALQCQKNYRKITF